MNKNLLGKISLLVILIPSIALATDDPAKVVEGWAKAAKERDGKKQYQLLCADQQDKTRATLESLNWVTGVSSPGIGKYKITKLTQKQDTTDFLVKYQIILQGKSVGTVSDQLQVKNGCISKFKYLSPTDEKPSK